MVTQSEIKKNEVTTKIANRFLFIASIAFILLFGFRDTDTGSDTNAYLFMFNDYTSFSFDSSILIYYIFELFHVFDFPFQLFLIIMSVLFVGILTVSIIKYSQIIQINPFLIFFSFISLFYFQSLGINVIKQGVSISFLLLAMVNYQQFKNKRIVWILPCLLSILFHFTSAIAILAYLFIHFFKNIKFKWYLLIYLGCILLSFLSLSVLNFKDFFSFLVIDNTKAQEYFSGDNEDYIIGFKTQFVVFNTVFLILFMYIRRNLLQNTYYDNLLKYYLLISSVFFLTFQIAYSDRWGLLSWVAIPFLLAPIFNLNFPKKLQIISSIGLILIFIFFENLA
jgi:hypothetical protein